MNIEHSLTTFLNATRTNRWSFYLFYGIIPNDTQYFFQWKSLIEEYVLLRIKNEIDIFFHFGNLWLIKSYLIFLWLLPWLYHWRKKSRTSMLAILIKVNDNIAQSMSLEINNNEAKITLQFEEAQASKVFNDYRLFFFKRRTKLSVGINILLVAISNEAISRWQKYWCFNTS